MYVGAKCMSHRCVRPTSVLSSICLQNPLSHINEAFHEASYDVQLRFGPLKILKNTVLSLLYLQNLLSNVYETLASLYWNVIVHIVIVFHSISW